MGEKRIIYRCGFCGCPVKENGDSLIERDRAIQITLIEAGGNKIKEELVNGDCCREGDSPRYATRDMATDAQDPNCEGREF